MNKIQAKQISSFNQQVLSIFIDDQAICDYLSATTNNPAFKNLWCAWLLDDARKAWEQDGSYIWNLIENKQACNLPILLCADDMDFYCDIVVAQVRYEADVVIWEKIGFVTGALDKEQWKRSGIQNIEKWSEKDWEWYGETLAHLDVDDKAWEEWWSANWLEEENRRLWNYYHPYFNDDSNIQWLEVESVSFLAKEYDACVAAFKQNKILM